MWVVEVGCAGRDVQAESNALAAKKDRERDSCRRARKDVSGFGAQCSGASARAVRP